MTRASVGTASARNSGKRGTMALRQDHPSRSLCLSGGLSMALREALIKVDTLRERFL